MSLNPATRLNTKDFHDLVFEQFDRNPALSKIIADLENPNLTNDNPLEETRVNENVNLFTKLAHIIMFRK